MARRIYQIRVSLESTGAPVWRRILVSANVTLRQAHGVLQKALGRDGKSPYCFAQDGREFGKCCDEGVYLEDDSMYSLRYCLCLVGHTLEYRDGPWKYSMELEAIQQAQGRMPWRVVDGAGVCPGAQNEAVSSRAAASLQ
jgi:pRiA4b ORF-3-like protein